MTTKSYTSLEQSRKLAEILPLESADMHYYKNHFDDYIEGLYNSNDLKDGFELKGIEYVPAWSLAALLNTLPDIKIRGSKKIGYIISYNKNIATKRHFDIVDACYEMILKLHELEML